MGSARTGSNPVGVDPVGVDPAGDGGDHVEQPLWRNGLGRPDRLCGRRFDPERTFFTNQDIFHISARSGSMPIVVDSPLV